MANGWKYAGLAAASTRVIASARNSPPGSRPSVSVVNEMAAGTPAASAARTIPIASLYFSVSAIIADRDSLHGNRSGNINSTLYREYQFAPSLFFHDVTGAGHIAMNNGLFPAVPGFDLATGIGAIKMAPFILGSF